MCCVALPCCLCDLACFFIPSLPPSHLSLNMYIMQEQKTDIVPSYPNIKTFKTSCSSYAHTHHLLSHHFIIASCIYRRMSSTTPYSYTPPPPPYTHTHTHTHSCHLPEMHRGHLTHIPPLTTNTIVETLSCVPDLCSLFLWCVW